MEDAIALVSSLQEADDLEPALAGYEAARRPAVERIQDIAERSRRWWETFPERLDLPVEQLLVAYMSRAGNVPLDRFAAGTPEVVSSALRQWAGEEPPTEGSLVEWVLERSLRPSSPGQEPDIDVVHEPVGTRGFDSRVVPDDPAAFAVTVLDVGTDARPSGSEDVVEDAVRRGVQVTDGVWLTGGDDRPSVLTRLEVAERLRRLTPALVVVAGPKELREDFADGLAADRAHLVALR
jgi:anthraniloyl-CoA monooxygenase